MKYPKLKVIPTHIVFQVKIYKMFRILSMLDETNVERVGDVLEWVFRSAMKVFDQPLNHS